MCHACSFWVRLRELVFIGNLALNRSLSPVAIVSLSSIHPPLREIR